MCVNGGVGGLDRVKGGGRGEREEGEEKEERGKRE